MNKKVITAMIAAGCALTCGCAVQKTSSEPENTGTENTGLLGTVVSSETSGEVSGTVYKDAKFGAAIITLCKEDLSEAGIELGDSCDIEFGNGYTMTDVPYYNGYYVKNGAGVLVAYPGSWNVLVTYNNEGIWETAELQDNDTVTIHLSEAGKYSAIQDSLGQSYSFNRSDYDSDEQFCNFRALSGGNLKSNYLYRGASPVDNSRHRAAYTDQLLADVQIQQIIDLADSEEDMAGYLADEDFNSPYAESLYEQGKIVLLDMGSAYTSAVYQEKVADGLKQMIGTEGPVYIHCMEGKDRTGFVCTLIEALAGASYDEMLADYMTTYRNYYKVSKENTPEKYQAIAELYFDSFVSYLHGTEDPEELAAADYTEDAKNYLRAGGMSDEDIQLLVNQITE